jgi:hypothetical protein
VLCAVDAFVDVAYFRDAGSQPRALLLAVCLLPRISARPIYCNNIGGSAWLILRQQGPKQEGSTAQHCSLVPATAWKELSEQMHSATMSLIERLYDH